jgi:Ca2+-binding RTX toxin-like protein
MVTSTGINLTFVEKALIGAKIQYDMDIGKNSDLSSTLTIMGLCEDAKVKANEWDGGTGAFVINLKNDLNSILSDGTIENIDDIIDETEEETIDDTIDETFNSANYSIVNSGITSIATSSSDGVLSLESNESWNTSSLTYSFNSQIPDEYWDEDNLTDGFTPLSDAQENAVIDIMNQIDNLLGISLTQVANDGDIRFSIINMDEDTAGFSYYPQGGDISGDVFLSTEYNTNPQLFGLEQGEAGWSTIVHEMGHVFGLKHPFEEGNELPASLDDLTHSIMSYTSIYEYTIDFELTPTAKGSSINAEYVRVEPDLYSIYDVNALHYKYGANETTNSGDNTYTINFTDFDFQTIWDTGGTDTLELSANTGNTTLDLNSGSLNSIDQYSTTQLVEYYRSVVDNGSFDEWIEEVVTDSAANNELYTGANNLGIATGVIIENINSGSGDDTITDNLVDNIINTAAGDDTIIIGHGGYDTIDGGDGTDTLQIDASRDEFTIEYNNDYLMYSDSYAVSFENIETIIFNGVSYSIDDLV